MIFSLLEYSKYEIFEMGKTTEQTEALFAPRDWTDLI